jgi:hemerythrin HHE cation binding domain-containing protein
MKQREVGEAYEASTSALEAAKGQRLSLRRAIAGLEEALAAPDGQVGRDGLPARLGPALERLREVFAVHVEVTEGPGGLYQEILENAPRLANRVTRFRREHAEITEGIRRAIAEAAAAADPEAVRALRDHTVRLFADLVRHRKRGLDLVYEAYHVDLGGES